MKQTKTILLTAFTTLLAFTAIVYTSCKKDPCSGVNCLNGGSCSNGNCLCPSGYTGSQCQYLAVTTITYNNNTFTTVYLVFNNTSYSIASGGTLSFTGSYGDAANATATTSGATNTGTQVGLQLSWSFTDNFPASGTLVEDINVSSSYFFLKIINSSAYIISQIYVNHGLTSQTYDL